MKFSIISTALAASVLLFSASLATAAETTTGAAKPAASQVKTNPKVAKSATTANAKPKAVAKLVDINRASAAELKKLPGITDADAAKIIAGRPYGSKAWLVSNNIIDGVIYANIKDLIIAKQPFKDAAKNAALYKAKK